MPDFARKFSLLLILPVIAVLFALAVMVLEGQGPAIISQSYGLTLERDDFPPAVAGQTVFQTSVAMRSTVMVAMFLCLTINPTPTVQPNAWPQRSWRFNLFPNTSLSMLLGPLMRRRRYRSSWREPALGLGIALGVVLLRYLLGRIF